MSRKQKGQLKLFFSYAESSGKTQAMLEAAQNAQAKGVRVLVGYIAPHTAAQTMDLLKDMEQLPPFLFAGQREFDLDAALARKPELVLVDEMAHTNPKNSRHRKRYQDIDELLQAGIDVYTTVNVSNIESLHDTVAAITGITTWERIPDDMFDRADQVELIDIEPQELLERLQECGGKTAPSTVEQLTALREIALRRCADRVKLLSNRQRQDSAFHTDEHILACLSSAPSNAKIIRTAARMARAFNSQFTALFVETPDFAEESVENKRRLRENFRLAEQLGAEIEVVYGEDVSYQIAEFSHVSGVTKIVLGRSEMSHQHFFGKPSLTQRLVSYAPEVNIHIIPDGDAELTTFRRKWTKREKTQVGADTLKSLRIFLGATLLSLLFDRLNFTAANIIMVYILGVQLIAIVTSHQIYSLIASAASVFVFNFLFTTPRFSLLANESGYPVTFVMMFLTAYITGTFASRYKKQAGQVAKVAYRTKILFDMDQLLTKADSKTQIIQAAAQQIVKLVGRNIVVFENVDGPLSEPYLFQSKSAPPQVYHVEEEMKTVQWVLKNNHAAGATTDTLSDAHYLYFAVRVSDRVYGVVGIEAEHTGLDAYEREILLSMLGEFALALANEKNARERAAAALLAESEQLRANLLRSISHDLRTPLTTISGNVSNLISNGQSFDDATKQRIYADIYDDSMWLTNLVENLLYATRIEENRMILRTTAELLDDIMEEAVHHIKPKAADHPIRLENSKELLLVCVDAKLIVQVVVNIVDNAIKYTPKGTPITLSTHRKGTMAEICIVDTGGGISDEDKARIFDKFYCGTSKIADNRRSLGLGLFLCKAIVEAHGGTIQVEDNQPSGTIFRFTLPLEEVTIHE